MGQLSVSWPSREFAATAALVDAFTMRSNELSHPADNGERTPASGSASSRRCRTISRACRHRTIEQPSSAPTASCRAARRIGRGLGSKQDGRKIGLNSGPSGLSDSPPIRAVVTGEAALVNSWTWRFQRNASASGCSVIMPLAKRGIKETENESRPIRRYSGLLLDCTRRVSRRLRARRDYGRSHTRPEGDRPIRNQR